MSYYIAKKLAVSFEDGISKVTEELKKEGFGIISEINIQDKLKEKLNVDFRKYKILGACNPPFAYEALQNEDKIGTMLPCNIIVQEYGENNIEIAAINPLVSMQGVDNIKLGDLAAKVSDKLEKIINSL